MVCVPSGTSFAFLVERKNMLKEKVVSPRSHPAAYHMHTNVYFLHIYEYIDAEV